MGDELNLYISIYVEIVLVLWHRVTANTHYGNCIVEQLALPLSCQQQCPKLLPFMAVALAVYLLIWIALPPPKQISWLRNYYFRLFLAISHLFFLSEQLLGFKTLFKDLLTQHLLLSVLTQIPNSTCTNTIISILIEKNQGLYSTVHGQPWSSTMQTYFMQNKFSKNLGSHFCQQSAMSSVD